MLENSDVQDEKLHLQKAIAHVTTIQIGARAFDAVKHFCDRRAQCPKVKLVIAEGNEAVITILSKGRSSKMRHVARTHRVNIDFLYEVFRCPEIIARYVKTDYQTADIATKAINK